MYEFTPGPWKTQDINFTGYTPVYVGPYLENGKTGGRLIAQCTGDRENALANAHLIAAAPDMYEALIQALGALSVDAMKNDDGEFFDATRVAMEAIKRALAKAEGKEAA